jgi:hypothetical protein
MLTEGWERRIFLAVLVMLKVFAAMLKICTWWMFILSPDMIYFSLNIP